MRIASILYHWIAPRTTDRGRTNTDRPEVSPYFPSPRVSPPHRLNRPTQLRRNSRPTVVDPPRRRRRADRARRNLLLGLVAFASIQLLLFGLLQWREHLRDPQFGDKKRQLERSINASPKPFVLLALGSSRTGMGFNGQIVSEKLNDTMQRSVMAFNFGIPAVGPVLELTYFKRLLADGIRPDLLLLEVHPGLLSNQLGQPIEKRGLFVEQLRYSEIDAIQSCGYLDDDAQLNWWGANLCPSHGARFALLGRMLPNWLSSGTRFDWGRRTDAWGWNATPWVDPSPQLRESALRVAKNEYERMLAELKFESAPVDALHQILAISKENGIPVVLLLMPEGPTFRSWYPEEVVQRLDSFIASLDTPFIDARTWVEEDEFLDSHHLLQTGARRFSTQLAAAMVPFVGTNHE